MRINNNTIFKRLYPALFLMLFACQNAPNAPVSEEKLTQVLFDIHTAEALVEGEVQDIRDSIARVYYAQICQKHNITQADFDSTMAVYTRNPVLLDTIYNRVLRRVKAERDSLTKH